jgi:hypothetical protein
MRKGDSSFSVAAARNPQYALQVIAKRRVRKREKERERERH